MPKTTYTRADRYYRRNRSNLLPSAAVDYRTKRQQDLEFAFGGLGVSRSLQSRKISRARKLATRMLDYTSWDLNHGVYVFKVVFACLGFYLLFFLVSNSERSNAISFSWLLNLFQNAPVLDMKWLFETDTFYANDWGIFDGLKPLIEGLLDFLRPLGFIVHGLTQSIAFFLYFLKSIFSVVLGG